jgi:MPBQ/MSBQ methyltransferase
MFFERKQVELYLKKQYAGVFDEQSIAFHIENHVGFGFSEGILPWVAEHTPAGGRVLDIGAGFGAFVIAARRLGLDAVGIELAAYEVDYACERLEHELPGSNPKDIFYLGDGHELPFDDEFFDSVTLWNVLEHVPDAGRLLRMVERVLKPGGHVFLICPNYAAFRREAHYQFYWFPLMPRPIASIYLKLRGKAPTFFEQSIFYRTNWEVLSALRKIGLQVVMPDEVLLSGRADISLEIRAKLALPDLVQDSRKRAILKGLKTMRLTGLLETLFGFYRRWQFFRLWWRQTTAWISVYNPIKNSITLCAKKAID